MKRWLRTMKRLPLRPEIANVWRKKAGVLRALGRETEAQEAERQADELEQPRAAG